GGIRGILTHVSLLDALLELGGEAVLMRDGGALSSVGYVVGGVVRTISTISTIGVPISVGTMGGGSSANSSGFTNSSASSSGFGNSSSIGAISAIRSGFGNSIGAHSSGGGPLGRLLELLCMPQYLKWCCRHREELHRLRGALEAIGESLGESLESGESGDCTTMGANIAKVLASLQDP
ncbi:hypothetical protein B484DRAFT_443742, partial [Ochromonadaceae sp. CCMP2298]